MTMLTREALLNREKKVVKVMLNKKEFVYVKELSGSERNLLEASIISFNTTDLSKVTEQSIQMNTSNLRAKYACLCLCDEAGVSLFTLDDAEQFGKSISATDLDTIITEADKLNAFLNKAKEDVVKN